METFFALGVSVFSIFSCSSVVHLKPIMANNLDDFFKKKDTKKSKGNKKFAVNNPLSMNITDSSKNGKVKQEKTTSFNPSPLVNENDLFSSQVRISST